MGEPKDGPAQPPQADDVTLNICGEVCPYTLVRTLLALEEMKPGDVLRVVLDYPPALNNVPKSLRTYGHEILAIDEAGPGRWTVVVRKSARPQ